MWLNHHKWIGVSLVITLGSCSQPEQALVYAIPDKPATLRFRVALDADIALSRTAPNAVRVSNPFNRTKPFSSTAFSGTPWLELPSEYWDKVNILEIPLQIPKNAARGEYPLEIEADFFVCSKTIKVCFKQPVRSTALLRVGQSGRDSIGVLKVKMP